MLMQGNSSSNEISYEGRMSGLSSDEIIEQELKKQVRQEDRVGSGAVSRSFDTPSRSSGKRTVLRGSIASQGCLERKAPVYNTAKWSPGWRVILCGCWHVKYSHVIFNHLSYQAGSAMCNMHRNQGWNDVLRSDCRRTYMNISKDYDPKHVTAANG